MALFPMRSNGPSDSFLWQKFNDLITILNRWADGINTFVTTATAFIATIGYATSTFAPTLGGSTTLGTWTYTTANGRYTKIGNVVHFTLNVTPASIAGSPAGDLLIGGLPFASNAVMGGVYPVMSTGLTWVVGATTYTQVTAYLGANLAYFRLYGSISNGAWGVIPVGSIVAGDNIWITGSYLTA